MKPLPSLYSEKGFLVQAHLKDISRASLHHKNKCAHSMLTGTFFTPLWSVEAHSQLQTGCPAQCSQASAQPAAI